MAAFEDLKGDAGRRRATQGDTGKCDAGAKRLGDRGVCLYPLYVQRPPPPGGLFFLKNWPKFWSWTE